MLPALLHGVCGSREGSPLWQRHCRNTCQTAVDTRLKRSENQGKFKSIDLFGVAHWAIGEDPCSTRMRLRLFHPQQICMSSTTLVAQRLLSSQRMSPGQGGVPPGCVRQHQWTPGGRRRSARSAARLRAPA